MTDTGKHGHSKFKAFTGVLAADHQIGALGDQIAAWVEKANVAPKSIGVEYLEASKRLVLTVGYRDDEPAYKIKLSSVSLGHIHTLDAGDLTSLEQKMEAAAGGVATLICHELYITEDNEFLMVFMSRP